MLPHSQLSFLHSFSFCFLPVFPTYIPCSPFFDPSTSILHSTSIPTLQLDALWKPPLFPFFAFLHFVHSFASYPTLTRSLCTCFSLYDKNLPLYPQVEEEGKRGTDGRRSGGVLWTRRTPLFCSVSPPFAFAFASSLSLQARRYSVDFLADPTLCPHFTFLWNDPNEKQPRLWLLTFDRLPPLLLSSSHRTSERLRLATLGYSTLSGTILSFTTDPTIFQRLNERTKPSVPPTLHLKNLPLLSSPLRPFKSLSTFTPTNLPFDVHVHVHAPQRTSSNELQPQTSTPPSLPPPPSLSALALLSLLFSTSHDLSTHPLPSTSFFSRARPWRLR